MFKFHDVEQNTDAWDEQRLARLTSSSLGKVMANGSGAFGEPAKDLAVRIAVEMITGKKSENESFSNSHTERGHEQEPIARMLYEEENFSDVTNGGFFEYVNGNWEHKEERPFIGCSPDGMVGDDGVIEIKCHIRAVHYKNVKRGKFDPGYKWQFWGNLKFTGRDWLDYISYCADYPEGQQLYTYRIHKEDYQAEFQMIDDRVGEFYETVMKVKDDILNSNYEVNK